MTFTRESRQTIGGAILLVALVGMSLSLLIPLLAIEMEKRGVSATISGLNTAFGGFGTLLAAPYVPRLAARLGASRLVAGAIMVSAATVVGFYLLPFWAWFPTRLAFGAALGTLFVLSEYWINAAAPADRRGFVMGIYATVLALGFALGPLVLGLAGTAGAAPYLACAMLTLAALIPMSFVRSGDLPLDPHGKARVLPFLIAVPTATFAGFVFGAVETGGFALFPVYGLRTGFSETSAALLVGVVAAGNVVSQVPLGWLSDRFDRRKVLLMCAGVGAATCALMPLALPSLPLFLATLFVFGGFTGGLYTVGLAHLGSRYTGLDLASANAAFVMLYSLGLIIGPPLVGAGMDAAGPQGLPGVVGLMLTAYAALILWRLRRKAFP
ncbi:MAG: MFS transporter [Beijerinckiaceae bacterium]